MDPYIPLQMYQRFGSGPPTDHSPVSEPSVPPRQDPGQPWRRRGSAAGEAGSAEQSFLVNLLISLAPVALLLSAALMEHESLDEKDAYRVAGVARQVSESNWRRPRTSDSPRSAAASD